jgi:uncharacterized protein
MNPNAFPDMRWRRLDVPGSEEARMTATPTGWILTGRLGYTEEGSLTSLSYRVLCDDRWHTVSAELRGTVGRRLVELLLVSDGEGRWRRDGSPIPSLAGTIDVDFGATPSTNTLPIRRLALAVGETRPVRAAWFRIPELRLEPLEQTYTREADDLYRFDALIDGALFTARLTTDAAGWVLRYEGLWEAEPGARAGR